MPRPLPPGGLRRRAVPLRLSAEEQAPVQAIADDEHTGNLSAAIRALLVEALVARSGLGATPPAGVSIAYVTYGAGVPRPTVDPTDLDAAPTRKDTDR